jgi:MFS family permease
MAFFIPLAVITMTTIFLKKPPPKTLSAQTQKKTYDAAKRDPFIVDLKGASRSWTLRQAIFTKQFWVLSVSFFLSCLITHSIFAHQVAFFVDEGLETLFVSYIVGMIGIVSIGGKIIWGTLSDRIGREITYTLVIACFICGMSLLITFPTLSSLYIPYLYAVFFGMGYAGLAVLPPLITADFFEGQTYGSIYGTTFVLTTVGGAFGTWLGGFLHDHLGNYILFFIIVIVCALFSCLNIWIAAPRRIRRAPGKRGSRFNWNSA